MSAPGRSAGFGGGTVRELVSAASTDGRVAVQEHGGARGFGHPTHAHTLEDEVLYVLEGEVEVTAGDRLVTASPGECVPLRRHEPHGWRIVSDGGRVLITTVPGAFADYFLDAGVRRPVGVRRARPAGCGSSRFRRRGARTGREQTARGARLDHRGGDRDGRGA